MKNITLVSLFIGACVSISPAWAEEPFIYPSEGQSEAQQAEDKQECRAWANDQTGIDPAALSAEYADKQAEVAQAGSEPVQAPVQQRGGAVRGAAAGAVIGEIANDDAGKGAAYGAAAGVISQRRRNARNQSAAQQQQAGQQQQAAQQQQQLSQEQKQKIETWYRAYGACLQGRGYTVS